MYTLQKGKIMEIEDVEKYKKLDLLNIVNEVVEWSEQLYAVGTVYAEYTSERDSLKENLEVTDAEVANHMRKEAERCNFKLTESQIKLDLLLTEEHVKAFCKYNDAKERALKADALVEAVRGKGKMIEKAIDLALRGLIDINDTSKLKEEIEKNRIVK